MVILRIEHECFTTKQIYCCWCTCDEKPRPEAASRLYQELQSTCFAEWVRERSELWENGGINEYPVEWDFNAISPSLIEFFQRFWLSNIWGHNYKTDKWWLGFDLGKKNLPHSRAFLMRVVDGRPVLVLEMVNVQGELTHQTRLLDKSVQWAVIRRNHHTDRLW